MTLCALGMCKPISNSCELLYLLQLYTLVPIHLLCVIAGNAIPLKVLLTGLVTLILLGYRTLISGKNSLYYIQVVSFLYQQGQWSGNETSSQFTRTWEQGYTLIGVMALEITQCVHLSLSIGPTREPGNKTSLHPSFCCLRYKLSPPHG